MLHFPQIIHLVNELMYLFERGATRRSYLVSTTCTVFNVIARKVTVAVKTGQVFSKSALNMRKRRRAGSNFKQGGQGQKSSFYHVTRYVDFDPFP